MIAQVSPIAFDAVGQFRPDYLTVNFRGSPRFRVEILYRLRDMRVFKCFVLLGAHATSAVR